MSSRLHFALAATEDAILQDVETMLSNDLPSARLHAYMFDGAILEMREEDIDLVQKSLLSVGSKWSVEFTVERFADIDPNLF